MLLREIMTFQSEYNSYCGSNVVFVVILHLMMITSNVQNLSSAMFNFCPNRSTALAEFQDALTLHQ